MRAISSLVVLSLIVGAVAAQTPARQEQFKPGAVWLDTKGNVINAHGGGLLYDKGTYYWFGEKRGKSASEGINVYASTDLYN